jgi:hypothetical protein
MIGRGDLPKAKRISVTQGQSKRIELTTQTQATRRQSLFWRWAVENAGGTAKGPEPDM